MPQVSGLTASEPALALDFEWLEVLSPVAFEALDAVPVGVSSEVELHAARAVIPAKKNPTAEGQAYFISTSPFSRNVRTMLPVILVLELAARFRHTAVHFAEPCSHVRRFRAASKSNLASLESSGLRSPATIEPIPPMARSWSRSRVCTFDAQPLQSTPDC